MLEEALEEAGIVRSVRVTHETARVTVRFVIKAEGMAEAMESAAVVLEDLRSEQGRGVLDKPVQLLVLNRPGEWRVRPER